MRSFEWGASIAVSWLWGLGLFFSWHFTVLYGPLGLLLFALPNAVGLLIFGLAAGRLTKRENPRLWIEAAFKRYPHIFYLYQLIAVALTLFAFAKYYLIPMGVSVAALLVAVALLFVACVVAERSTLAKLVRVHAYVFLALAGAFLVMAATWPPALTETAEAAPRDASFYALLVPIAFGLLLGPWFDLQQWQRAVGIVEAGKSVAGNFAAGAGLFFLLLLANGVLALWSGLGVSSAFPGVFDTHLHAQSAVPEFVAEYGSTAFKIAFAVWVVGAVFTTFDSSRLAMRWFLVKTLGESDSLLAGLLPEVVRTATTPFYALAVFVAGLGVMMSIDLEYFMIYFASLFLAFSTVLLREAITGRVYRGQSQIFAVGIASLCLLSAGYLGDHPVWTVLAPLVALSGFLLVGDHIEPGSVVAGAGDKAKDANPAGIIAPIAEPQATTTPPATVTALSPLEPGEDADSLPAAYRGWFDGKWFNSHIISTYADTNSVGNVYFSTYVTWVGKTRELFFRTCLPNFDLKQTQFFILTRNFQHKFVRETREFDELSCRLKIKRYNRKFVELQHEIRDKTSQLVGEGSQTLMFVDSGDYRLIDIPDQVVNAFIRYA